MQTASRTLFAAVALALTLGPAQAQATLEADAKGYPNRAIRIIVPFPPGGPADTIARLVGQRMSEDWGQPVLIENRAGGNTAIGAQAAARAAADGYTLLAAMDTTMVINPLVAPNLPYDPLKDFVLITLLTKTMSLVVVRSDGPKTIKELVAKAKANPGTLNMGAGTMTSRLGALQFAKAAGIDVQLVPFKGSTVEGKIDRSCEVASIYSDAAMTTKLEHIGIPALRSSSPAEFAAFIRSETERWSEVLKESGNVKLD
jgi:tripartite-type tricarboxylate transporter receptor subunit TctC